MNPSQNQSYDHKSALNNINNFLVTNDLKTNVEAY